MSKAKARSRRALANILAREVYVMQDPTEVTIWDVFEGVAPKYSRLDGAQFSAFASIRLARLHGERVMVFARVKARLQCSVMNCLSMAALGARISSMASSGLPSFGYPKTTDVVLSAVLPPRRENQRPTAE